MSLSNWCLSIGWTLIVVWFNDLRSCLGRVFMCCDGSRMIKARSIGDSGQCRRQGDGGEDEDEKLHREVVIFKRGTMIATQS